MGYKERVRNSLYGLAIGDAISWPAFYHRTYTLPFWTRRLRREIDAAQEEQNIIRFPMPFSLNRPTENLQFGPTDDTEWAAFTAQLLIESEGNLTRDRVYEKWSQLAKEAENVRGSISVQGALRNIQKGAKPPMTGQDNPHYFDDSACSRAVVIGAAFPGKLENVLELVSFDGEVTNSLDGLWAAQGLGSAVSTACAGGTWQEAVSNSVSVLPTGSWVRRTVCQALELAENYVGFSAIPQLDLLVNKEYSYGGAAPEVLALTLAVTVLVEGDFEKGITMSLYGRVTKDNREGLFL
jgi:ADP-ribosylglycohydrolase